MRKSEITIGSTYWANVSHDRVPVRIESTSPKGGWVARSIKTGREVVIKTAARLLGECSAKEQAKTSKESKPNRRSRKKVVKVSEPKPVRAKPTRDKEPLKAKKAKRREAVLQAVAQVLENDPKKAKTVKIIGAEVSTLDLEECPTHGAIFYALKIDLEQNADTRFASIDNEQGVAYYLRKAKKR